jgi:hypothetical protein
VLILLLTYFQLALLPPSLSSSPLTILKTIWIMNLGDSGHVDRERETRYIKNVLSLSLSPPVCVWVLQYITTRIRTSSPDTYIYIQLPDYDRYLMTRKYHRDDIILSLRSIHEEKGGGDHHHHVFDIY